MSTQTSSSGSDALSEKDKIQILLAEYNTLRTELLNRHTAGFQMVAIGTAVLTWLAAQSIDAKFLVLSVVFSIVMACWIWVLYADIRRLGVRIRQLEEDVNRRAGEPLLIWESRWGGNVVGIWKRLLRAWGPLEK